MEISTELTNMIGQLDATHAIRLARKIQMVEDAWARKLSLEIDHTTERVLAESARKGRIVTSGIDFTRAIMLGARSCIETAIETARRPVNVGAKLSRERLPPDPKSLKELRKWWDAYRKGQVPARQARLAKRLKGEYLKRLAQTWREHSEEFLNGDTYDNTAAEMAIKKAAGVTKSRAKLIAETETTRHFNLTHREIFDQSPDVTHYLFAAIRDHRTTRWCKTRHGLVYAKGDPLLERETPPIHWRCRSQILPLSIKNPAHRRLIENERRWRRRNKCEPLPRGWNEPA